jgi:hypothetical protein
MCRVRYFDPIRKRPGLPPDVAALVEKVEPERTVVRLINLSPFQAQDVLIQAGAFGEHTITFVEYLARTSEYPGRLEDYAPPALQLDIRRADVQGKHLQVHMPPATEMLLDLKMKRFVNDPSYSLPWQENM